MACAEKLLDDGLADEASGAGDEYTHIIDTDSSRGMRKMHFHQGSGKDKSSGMGVVFF